MDLGDVDGETVERAGLKDKDFESFLKRLLRAELRLRHRPDADIKGPGRAYQGDDQRDLVFVVHGPTTTPRTHFTAALTWDQPGETWYSCKGGGSWRSTILSELGQDAYNRYKKSGTVPSARVKKRPSKRLLAHLAGGGRYVFVISVAAIDDRGLLDAVSEQLEFWLRHEQLSVPKQLRRQLEFIDANRLGEFISTHKPELGETFRAALGLVEPHGLKSWRQWTQEHGAGRDLPAFEADEQRRELFETIADNTVRVLRVFGPPGVGKTRVIYEGIKSCGEDMQARTRYSDELDLSRRVVQDEWLRRGGGPWLVLDELRSVDVEQVISKFHANAGPDARLFLVGTADGQARPRPGQVFELSQLGEAQCRRLIRNEASGLDDAQLDAIWKLSEGYPWYAVLLTRAVRDSDPLLEHGDDDATRWAYGTQRVLAGNPDEHADWAREAELRAKTLLVAMLTRDLELDWDELWERHGERLRLAIDEPRDWHEVKRREQVCRERQLLRRSGVSAVRRYVSPNNLARIILHHFLTDPDLGPKLRRHVPEWRATLVEIAKAVRVKPALLEHLARGEWEELQRRAREGVDAIETYVRHDQACYEAARDLPELAARTMAAIIVHLSAEQLAAADNLRVVSRFVFAHLIHRKLSPEAFASVEAALLTLALAEDGESRFANDARGIWKSLFLPGLHATHQPWELRRGCLDARLADASAATRKLAIDALEFAVQPDETGLGYGEEDRVDGDWPRPTGAEYLDQKTQLWARLLHACDDREPALASHAQSMCARHFRGGIGRGLVADGLAELTRRAQGWGDATRLELLESIADLRRYDLDDYAELPELLDGVDALERAIAPTELRQRTLAQFGTWHPGPLQIDDPDRPARERADDLELVRELLSDPAALSWALDWSTSPDACRKRAMWAALGQLDRGGGVLTHLAEAITVDGFPVLALGEYLLGWAEATTAEQVEAWLLAPARANAVEIAPAQLRFLVFQAPTPARLARVATLIEHGTRDPRSLALLGLRGWAKQLEPELISKFIAGLPDAGTLLELRLRLGLALLERELEPELRGTTLDQLGSALLGGLELRVAGGIQHLATQAALALAGAGRLELISSAISRALDTSANMYLGHALLAAVLREGYGEALWPWLAGVLLEQDASWQLARERVLAHVPAPTVLDWVGEDPHRAGVVADLTNPHGPQLGPVVRELLLRFGAEGEVASRLRARALSSPGVVTGGPMSFERRQLEHARAWARDDALPIRSWAQRIEAILSERVEEYDARVELRAKYG